MKNIKKYDSLNGLRAFACIGIILMHILSNSEYILNNTLTLIIESFTQFVYLFMIVSAFSMCCGYYNKIKENKILLEEFYTKRIKKIMPFFILLVIIEVLYNHNLSSIVEGFSNITMMFSFLPRTLDIIGVGWFLGLVFIFYMIFPFFVYLFSNKKRAILVTMIAFVMNIISVSYYGIGRINMFHSFIFFCIGGLIYLYKEMIIKFVKNNKILVLLILIILIIMYYYFNFNQIISNIFYMLIFGLLTCFSISIQTKFLNNNIVNYISNISFEIYLSHMLVFRVIEKVGMLNIIKNNYFSYFFICCICLFGTIVFVKGYNYFFKYICNKLNGGK